ncbi:alpha/beta fold hydrolase [Nocardia sp. NPDC127526]|uniref:alpha/beta fold hydrolase n=1 Tax=Nocardia sp. NPDC127526 TaxID=3345393 RepID=UPI003629637B
MTRSTTTTATAAPWTGMVATEDTALAVTDTRGPGIAVVYLNGCYADQKHWQQTITELGPDFRHITFDARARGKSKTSFDYSFAACLRDIDAVLNAVGVRQAILVGWSYGASLAVHYAEQNPGRVLGVVSADGAMPYGLAGEEGREQIRKIFRRMRFLLPLARPFGMAARMSADEHAEINIEINEISATTMAGVLENVTRPVRYVLATGSNLGGSAEDMAAARASLDPILAANPNITISAQVPSNHSHILRKDFRAIADAVRATAHHEAAAR